MRVTAHWDQYTERVLDELPKWLLAALVQEFASTAPECESSDDPATVRAVIVQKIDAVAESRGPDRQRVERAAGTFLQRIAANAERRSATQ